MTNKSLREYIGGINPDAKLFDNPSFDNSIIGTSEDGCVIYDYDKMVEEYVKDNPDENADMEQQMADAEDFISYNTLRTLPYAGEYAPIVLMNKDVVDFIKEDDSTEDKTA